MKVLNLTLHYRWFHMIKRGNKPEEYRDIKKYWIQRLTWHEFHKALPEEIAEEMLRKDIDIIRFKNGYAKSADTFDIECKGLEIRSGETKWGAEPGAKYFVIKLGKILS